MGGLCDPGDNEQVVGEGQPGDSYRKNRGHPTHPQVNTRISILERWVATRLR